MTVSDAQEKIVDPLANEGGFRAAEYERMVTPALLIDRERVAHNVMTTIGLLGGDPNRWRPHVKTAKLWYTMHMLVEAGVLHFKCATGLELRVACEAGARDVLLAFPLVGANAVRLHEIAQQHPGVCVSVLAESREQIEQWRDAGIGVFLDVNPGMNRTGVPQEHEDEIVDLCRAMKEQRVPFRGLHYYDGHLSKYSMPERTEHAHRGYDRLMGLVASLAKAGVEVPEVITAGTPALPCSVSYAAFSDAPFVHRVSPGTVVYCDMTSLQQLPPEYGYVPAAAVMTRVISHPAPGMITCDAGHKTVSADAGIPTCAVMGHPELEPLTPSEEHLPMKVTRGPAPRIGDTLFLIPRHVCPTVNNFDEAVIVQSGYALRVEAVSARGRERPIRL
jgi:D-serine deaminase-like pyridoxal phosphate-dependent protein